MLFFFAFGNSKADASKVCNQLLSLVSQYSRKKTPFSNHILTKVEHVDHKPTMKQKNRASDSVALGTGKPAPP